MMVPYNESENGGKPGDLFTDSFSLSDLTFKISLITLLI